MDFADSRALRLDQSSLKTQTQPTAPRSRANARWRSLENGTCRLQPDPVRVNRFIKFLYTATLVVAAYDTAIGTKAWLRRRQRSNLRSRRVAERTQEQNMNNATVQAIHNSAPRASTSSTQRQSSVTKRRQATLTVSRRKKRPDEAVRGPAYGGLLECMGQSIWLEQPTTLGVAAYVMNIGTVELRLPSGKSCSEKLYAHQWRIPCDVDKLMGRTTGTLSERQSDGNLGTFVCSFLTGLRLRKQVLTHEPLFIEMFREKHLAAAIDATPATLRINQTLI